MKHIHISTGDSKGIGLEVTVKALNSLKVSSKVLNNVRFFIWRENKRIPTFLQPEFKRLKQKYSSKNLTQVLSSKAPILQVQEISKICSQNPEQTALVTAPLSKEESQKHGYKGHTDFFRKEFSKNLLMCFLGEKFNVALLTDHQPLRSVKVSSSKVRGALKKLLEFNKVLKNKKPIGVLGLNPHAGENGILGSEEEQILKPIIKEFKKNVQGPLVPDVCFQSSYQKRFSFYLCHYHDQGLIPFKMVHSLSGVQITLGLPFIRTSVDHGTAFDLYGKNKAQKASMKKAIETALFLLSRS